jgi:hypothetical protein
MEWLKEQHSGKGKAINAKDMKQWGTRREIRLMTHDLRKAGYPICSGFTGYYYASTQSEIQQTLNFLLSMQEDLGHVIDGMQDAYDSAEDGA